MAISVRVGAVSVRRLPSACLFLGLLGSVLGCSVTVDANRVQCTRNSDCTARGAAFAGSVCAENACTSDPKWACINDVPQPDAGGSYKATMHVRDVLGSLALPGVNAQLCRKLDVLCEKPLAKTVSDDKGTFVLPVDGNFDGFVQMTAPEIAPSMYFFNPPVSADQDLPPISLASPAIAAGIAFQAGGTLLADRGIMLLTTTDCHQAPAANVSYSIGGTRDPATFVFYLFAGVPTTDTSVTDATGYGGLVNMPQGFSTITALLAPDQRKVGTISLLVRPGYVTYSQIYAGAM
ncbi:MAG: hypothetical protein ABIQ16_28010 [Polyangiaceae bacterium]